MREKRTGAKCKAPVSSKGEIIKYNDFFRMLTCIISLFEKNIYTKTASEDGLENIFDDPVAVKFVNRFGLGARMNQTTNTVCKQNVNHSGIKNGHNFARSEERMSHDLTGAISARLAVGIAAFGC
jgi:hypothetical protein